MNGLLLLALLLATIPDQGLKLHAHAKESNGLDELTDPLKVKEKIGAVPGGLLSDSEVVKREAESMSRRPLRGDAEKLKSHPMKLTRKPPRKHLKMKRKEKLVKKILKRWRKRL